MTQVPMLDLKGQYSAIREEVRAALDRVCDSQRFILGPEVAALENAVASICGVRHAVGVSSGTDALLISLMALNVGPGDEVVTTPYSFFATAGVIARLGARPVFVDIDPATFNIDVRTAAARVGERTKAIIPVHLFGRCADMRPLLEIAGERGVHLIEDAAQALGSFDDHDRRAGSIGHLGCFSFFPSKNLGGFGDGGMVVSNDDALAEKVRVLRVHGGKPKYHHRVIGGNFRLDELQAAVLNVKLPYLSKWTSARRANADSYRRLFAEARLENNVSLPMDCQGHVYNQFVIRAQARDDLRVYLRSRGVETEVYYPVPLHLQECFSELGYREGDFVQSERAARETLALPVYPEMTGQQQRYVVQTISEFYGEQTVDLASSVDIGSSRL